MRDYSEIDYDRGIYYADQTGWTCDDFLFLNLYLNRMLGYKGTPRWPQGERPPRMDEIEQLDLTRMTDQTKVLLYILINKKCPHLFKLENLRGLEGTQPLEERLLLRDPPTNIHPHYDEYNVGW